MILFDPSWVQASNWGNDVAGKRARREIDRLCSDNEAGGRDGKEER
jgi:hypothetical protein